MELNKWENILVEWVNCLNVCAPINNIQECSLNFITDLLIKLFPDDFDNTDNLTWQSVTRVLKDKYPDFIFEYTDEDVDLIKVPCIEITLSNTLLLHYVCIVKHQTDLTSLMCKTLKRNTQVVLREFLATLPTRITRRVLKEHLLSLSVETNKTATPRVSYEASGGTDESPLQEFLHTPAVGRSVRKRENRQLKHLRAQLDQERVEKDDLLEELQKQYEKVNELDKRLAGKTNDIGVLRQRLISLENQTPPKSTNSEQCKETQRRCQAQTEHLEERIDDLNTKLDDLQEERINLLNKLKKSDSQIKEWQAKFNDGELLSLRLTDETCKYKDQIATLRSNCSELTALLEELQSERRKDDVDGSFTADNESLGKSVVDVQLRDALKSNQELGQKMDCLRMELDAFRFKSDEMEIENEQMHRTMKTLEESNASMYENFTMQLNDKSVEVQNLHSKNNIVTSQLNTLSQTHEQLNNNLVEIEQNYKRLKERSNEVENLLEEKTNELQQKNFKMSALQAEFDNLNANINTCCAKLNVLVANSEDDLNFDIFTTTEKIRMNHEANLNTIKAMEKDKFNFENTIKELQVHIERMTELGNVNEMEIIQLKDNVERQKEENLFLESNVNNYSSQIINLLASIAQKDSVIKELETLRDVVLHKDEQINQMLATNEDLNVKKIRLEEFTKNLNVKIVELDNLSIGHEMERKELCKRIKQLQDSCEAKSAREFELLLELETVRKQLTSNIEELRISLTDNQAETLNLHENLQLATEECKRLESLRSQYEERCETLKTKTETLTTCVEALQEKLTRTEAESNDWNQKYDELQQNYDRVNSVLKNATENNTELEDNVVKMRNILNAEMKEKLYIEENIASYDIAIEERQRTIASLQDDVAALQQKNDMLQTQLNDMIAQLESERQKVEDYEKIEVEQRELITEIKNNMTNLQEALINEQSALKNLRHEKNELSKELGRKSQETIENCAKISELMVAMEKRSEFYESKITNLETMANELETCNVSLRHEISELGQVKAELKSALLQEANEKSMTKELLNKVEHALSQTTEQLRERELEMFNQKTMLSVQESHWKEQNCKLHEQLDGLKEISRHAQEKLFSLSKDHEEMKLGRNELVEHISVVKQELENERQENVKLIEVECNLNATINKLNMEITNLLDEQKTLEDNLQKVSSAQNEAEKRVEVLSDDVKQYESASRTNNANLDQNVLEITILNNKLLTLTEQLANAEQSKLKYKLSLEEYAENLKKSEANYKTASDDNAELKQTIADAETKLRDFHAQLADSLTVSTDMTKQIETLNEKLSVTENKKRLLEKKYYETESQFCDVKEQMDQVQNDRNIIQEILREKQTERDALNEDNANVNNQLISLQEIINAERKTVQNLERNLNAMDQKLQTSSDEIMRLSTLQFELNDSLLKISTDKTAAEQKCILLEKEKVQLTENLKRLTMQIQTNNEEKCKLQEQLGKLTMELRNRDEIIQETEGNILRAYEQAKTIKSDLNEKEKTKEKSLLTQIEIELDEEKSLRSTLEEDLILVRKERDTAFKTLVESRRCIGELMKVFNVIPDNQNLVFNEQSVTEYEKYMEEIVATYKEQNEKVSSLEENLHSVATELNKAVEDKRVTDEKYEKLWAEYNLNNNNNKKTKIEKENVLRKSNTMNKPSTIDMKVLEDESRRKINALRQKLVASETAKTNLEKKLQQSRAESDKYGDAAYKTLLQDNIRLKEEFTAYEVQHRKLLIDYVQLQSIKGTLLNDDDQGKKELLRLKESYGNLMSEKSKLELECATLNKILKDRTGQLSDHSLIKEAYDKLVEDNNKILTELDTVKFKRCRDRDEYRRLLKKEKEESEADMNQKVHEVRTEYEGKLDKMKTKMITLYKEEVDKEVQRITAEKDLLYKKNDQLRKERDVLQAKLMAKMDKKPFDTRTSSNCAYSSRESLSSRHSSMSITGSRRQPGVAVREVPETRRFSTLPRTLPPDVIEESVTFSRRRSINSLPSGIMAKAMAMEDEEGDFFNNKYLDDMKEGRCVVPTHRDSNVSRLSELQRRNSMYPPHLKSSYPAETQFNSPTRYKEDDIKSGIIDMDDSMSRALLPGEKPRKKDAGTTSYKKPGPPTPSKNGGRVSLQGSDFQHFGGRDLTDSATGKTPKKVSTPNRIRQLFMGRNSSSVRDTTENNQSGTPKSKRLSIFRKPK